MPGREKKIIETWGSEKLDRYNIIFKNNHL